jgi:hypothetical protein
MKKFFSQFSLLFSLVTSSLVFGLLNPNVTNALEPCFSNNPDQNWVLLESEPFYRDPRGLNSRYVRISEPKEALESIRNSPRDFVKVKGLEIKILNGDWQVLPANGPYIVLLPGDAYRAYISYEGRSCSKRTIHLTAVEIKEVPSVDMSQYIQKISSNFQQEDKYKKIFGESLPLNLSADVQLGENEFERARVSNEALNVLASKGARMLFDTSCARTISNGGSFSKFMREGVYPVNGAVPKFLKIGKCSAKIYDAVVAEEVNYTNLMYLGTVTFNVSDPLNTLKQSKANNSIVCVKGKTTKKFSGANSKCPKGFKKV